MDTKTDKTIMDNKVVDEMIATEKSYNDALTLLQAALYINENIEGSSLLSEIKDSISIFKNISDSFIEHALNAVNPEVSEKEHRIYREQRIQLMSAFFLAYKRYSELFEQYCIECRKTPEIFKKAEQFLAMSPKKLGLGAILIQPIQRGPRYFLLVKESLKNNVHLTENNIAEIERMVSLVSEQLSLINTELNNKSNTAPKSEDAYYVGKYTLTAVTTIGNFFSSRMASESDAIPQPINEVQSSKAGYKLGDGSRYIYGCLANLSVFSSKPQDQNAQIPQIQVAPPPSDINIEEFTLIEDAGDFSATDAGYTPQ